ncbi:hypothetical protein ADIS_0376 [Lunatimonas lonarensis]|jgi:hypothetical protein|uniref:Uncharacterized protein n=1 Tax=Lunatimonas lonarensis TaxID=1232681 RepID=R7ZYH7_9BACT|nr:hypothetical protein [Lunatimonas lonarensis]EON79147.1 hypothetical protein ADIS_0376 [Lunatimonas lonarensis]
MSSLVIDLFLCGVAYVVLIYFVATMTKTRINKNRNNDDDGDGGVEDLTPPKIDLPPGIVWPTDDAPKPTKPQVVEY